jgi:hypothetical protein
MVSLDDTEYDPEKKNLVGTGSNKIRVPSPDDFETSYLDFTPNERKTSLFIIFLIC